MGSVMKVPVYCIHIDPYCRNQTLQMYGSFERFGNLLTVKHRKDEVFQLQFSNIYYVFEQ